MKKFTGKAADCTELQPSGCGQSSLRRHGDLLGSRAILHVAHHALAGGFHHAGEFAAGDERRRRSAVIGAAGGHGVGEIHSDSFHAHDHFARLWAAGRARRALRELPVHRDG